MLSLPQSVAEPQSIAQNTTTTTTHIWLGSEIAFDIQDDAVIKYLHGIKLIESDFGLYLYDAHGNVTELLDNEYNIGGCLLMQSFDINSAIDDAAGLNSYTDPNPYRYCGEYFGNKTGYVYLRARCYDPSICRFISVYTADGYVPIEEIESGDRVFAENPETGEKGIRTVVQTFVNETDELVHISVKV